MFTNCENTLLAFAILGIVAPCTNGANKPTQEAFLDLPASIAIGKDASPEDIKEYKGYLYTSNFFAGVITLIKLSDLSTSNFVAASATPYTSGWGLNILPSKNWLLSIATKPYDFKPASAVGQMG